MAQTVTLNTLDLTPDIPQFTVVQVFELTPTGITSDEAVGSHEVTGGGEEFPLGFLPI